MGKARAEGTQLSEPRLSAPVTSKWSFSLRCEEEIGAGKFRAIAMRGFVYIPLSLSLF